MWSPDGNFFTSYSRYGEIKLWNLSGKLLGSIDSKSSRINGILWSPNSKFLVSANEDGTVNLWSIFGDLLTSIKAHNTSTNMLLWSPDGNVIASAGENRTVKIWNLDLESALIKSCDWARDYLTNNPNVSEEDKKICDGIE